jgi:hypothetical protein
MNRLLISMDVEEFDIPEEFGDTVSPGEKLSVSHAGLLRALELFDKYQVRATFFITAYWAQQYPALVKQLAEKHEIASHLFYHSSFEEGDMERSRLELERISGQPVKGFRMPRLRPVNMVELKQAGYTYDASLNPTWLPGRYNHLDKPRVPFMKELWVMPSSVSPLCRYPVFWLSVKNMPLWVTRYFCNRIMAKDKLLTFYFHPWELCDLQKYQLPGYIRYTSGDHMYKRMDGFLAYLQQKGTFVSHSDYLATL